MGNFLKSRFFGVLGIVLLAAACFGLGYWQGDRAEQAKAHGVAVNKVVLPTGVDPGGAHPVYNATPEMMEFLQNQSTLSHEMEELRSRAPNGTPTPQMMAEFQQHNADLMNRQRQLSQIIAQQRQNNHTLPPPPPVHIPPNASPQMKDYLTVRDQLLRDQIAFMNQHSSDSPAVRKEAMDLWRQQNADRFQQLQKMAQTLSPPQTNTTPKPPTPPAPPKS